MALDDVSLKIRRGERVVVLGHNGSGKSTLVKILGALQAPLQGACFVAGRDARDIPFHKLRCLLGVVFQDPESQIVAARVEDDAAFAPENQGLPPDEIEERVVRALGRVGMLGRRGALVSALSGGEKQRVALAGALAARPLCLILDEPTAMLDPEGRFDVETALRAIHGDGTTLVQVTHQIENFEDVDRVLVLDMGRLAWEGRTEDFWPRAEALGFELPPSLWLAGRLGVRGGALAPAIEARFAGRPPRLSGPPSDPAGWTFAPFIEVRELGFRFDGPPVAGMAEMALKEVSMDVPKGGWLSIVGRTGSGKSTLAQHLNGLYKIQTGSILMEGEPLPQKGEGLHALRRRVGLVFQSPEDQFFCPMVEEEISFAPRNAGLAGEELERAVLGALDRVGLGRDVLGRPPLCLSGGERRLTAIASVLAARPECLVLDEPTAGLDARYRKRILALLSGLREEGRSVVVITHDLDMALRFSDRLLLLDGGRVLAWGTPRAVLPALMEALRPEVWPDALRLSARLRARFPDIPLTWDMEELARAL